MGAQFDIKTYKYRLSSTDLIKLGVAEFRLVAPTEAGYMIAPIDGGPPSLLEHSRFNEGLRTGYVEVRRADGGEESALLNLAVQAYLSPQQPTRQHVIREVERAFQKENIERRLDGRPELRKPSRQTIRRTLDRMSPFQCDLARLGLDAATGPRGRQDREAQRERAHAVHRLDALHERRHVAPRQRREVPIFAGLPWQGLGDPLHRMHALAEPAPARPVQHGVHPLLDPPRRLGLRDPNGRQDREQVGLRDVRDRLRADHREGVCFQR